jgi:hypothetical protein
LERVVVLTFVFLLDLSCLKVNYGEAIREALSFSIACPAKANFKANLHKKIDQS